MLDVQGCKSDVQGVEFHLIGFYELHEGGPMTGVLCLDIALIKCF
jgi:hypothetical protein